MKTKDMIGILIVIGLIVVISGCTSSGNNNTTNTATEKVLMNSNISADDVKNINLAVPDGISKIKVEYSNLTENRDGAGSFDFYVLTVTPQEGQSVSNYVDNATDIKSVFVESDYMNGSLELDAQNAKSMVIVANSLKGNIKVSAI